MMVEAQMPIINLPGIGVKRAELLNALHIMTLLDLVLYFPRDYDDRSEIREIASLTPGIVNTIQATIQKPAENLNIGGKIITRQEIGDNTGVLEIVWFNQPYMKKQFVKGSPYVFTGKVSEKFGKLQMEAPDYEAITGKELINSARIVPVYPSAKALSQKMLRRLIKSVIDGGLFFIEENLPQRVLGSYELCCRKFAIENIHFPQDRDSFFRARKRLVFEELLFMQLALFRAKGYMKSKPGKVMKNLAIEKLMAIMPFAFTPAQQKVLDEIRTDLASGQGMCRLIQGDVGSGKTAVAMAAAFITAENGGQTALMAPTEVLALQHYETFCRFFEPLGIGTVLLTGNLPEKERRKAYEEISAGKAKMIIGTHALVQKKVMFSRLELVITDEQHRFGVNQRLALAGKAQNPHVLVMSATPIPRTLGLILYGDMDISIIDSLPPGRWPVDTFAVNTSYRQRIYQFIKKELRQGRQAYIICPSIEEGEAAGIQSVEAVTKGLKKVFSEFRVECLHGKMKPDEKQTVMNDFTARRIGIIVSTTVIEVGVNVPNATVMVIENAERFGLSQLHQLRGRVGRGSDKSYCILLSDSKTKTAQERLSVMKNTNDGFVISEMDLKLRGPGDFFGARQHGLPEFRLANLYKDMDILKLAQQAAADLFTEKVELNESEKKQLDDSLAGIYSRLASEAELPGI